MHIIYNHVILNYFRSAGGWDVRDVTSGMVLVVFLLLLMLLLSFFSSSLDSSSPKNEFLPARKNISAFAMEKYFLVLPPPIC